MIEKVVRYIEERGYSVSVYPEILRIYKMVGDQMVFVDWRIVHFEREPLERALWSAQDRMDIIARAIEARQSLC